MTASQHPELLDVEALRQQARAGRKAFAQSVLSRFVVKMREVIADYLKARSEGVSREDGIRGIETVLRAEWPGRTSRYDTCAGCDNTGWRLTECNHGMRCGRRRCAFEADDYTHTFVVPCECGLGDKFRETLRRRAEKAAGGGGDDLTAVGKTKKRGSWARLGR